VTEARPTATRYWEDVTGSESEVGPVVITSDEFSQYLALSREHYLSHTDDEFAREEKMRSRIIPGTFVHAVAAGRVGEARGYAGVICVRSAHYDYLAPVHPDQPFLIKTRVSAGEIVDERRAMIDLVRHILDEERQVLSIARLNVLLARRPAGSR
jgi:acyl dehydratase